MAADRSPGGFGAKLREARERRGVSLRQIANATKISISALEALERNDVSRLPGGIFSRAFVRSYAVEVGLDPDSTTQEFIASLPIDAGAGAHAASDEVEDGISVENDRKRAGTFLWLIALSVPIAGALLYYATLGRGGEPRSRSAPPAGTTPAGRDSDRVEPSRPVDTAPPSVNPTAAPTAGDVALPATSPTAGTMPPRQPATAAAAATPAAERLTVALSVRRPCYVSAVVDGQKTIDRLLQAGEQQTIEVAREIVLTAGDASAIVLRFNGAPARPLGKAGEVVTARFNLANYKDFVQSR